MDKILKIGHRGAKGHSPENTLISFEKAFLMNADGIELDVHLSSDGEILVIHDATVDRTTNGKGKVSEMTLRQIKELRIAGKYEVPELSEVFQATNKDSFVNIELKIDTVTKPVVKLIAKYISQGKHDYRNFLVSSFDWNALLLVRELDPQIQIGVLTQTDLNLAVQFSEFIKAETIHPYFHLLNNENTPAIQEKGLRVFPWTVNNPEDIFKIKQLKVNGIITDFPDRL